MKTNEIILGDCLDVMKTFPDESIDLCFTSPPYAEQRKNQYESIKEVEYPRWTVRWMREVKRLLRPNGSVGIVIRTRIKNGIISKYVLNTRLSLWDDGWIEPEELIWIKPDSPPLGSIYRPRRSWESILWFALSGDIYCNPKDGGNYSNRIGFENDKFEHGGVSHIHKGQNKARDGKSRCRDYVESGTHEIESGINHPAMFTENLAKYMILLCCPENGVVLDPFIGSGTTAVSCVNTSRKFIGIEKRKKYFDIAVERLQNMVK